MTEGRLSRVLADLTHGGVVRADETEEQRKDVLRAREIALSDVAREPSAETASIGRTSFGYLFPGLSDADLLPPGEATVAALDALGNAMIDQQDDAEGNSPIPPIYTYWGQFVDHDITANTDRDATSPVTSITVEHPQPLDRGVVVRELQNLRSPALNLDSVYGDGPFVDRPNANDAAVPYTGVKLTLGRLTPASRGVRIPPVDDMERDLPRDAAGTALIGDGRNDENLVVAQLHVAFLRFHNAAVDWVRANEPDRISDAEVFLRARDLLRWTYQWLVVHDYLRTITAPGVVDTVLTDDFDLLDLEGRGGYMPLEFSVAAFRFGHSMVRAGYDWNRNFGKPGNNGARFASFEQLFQFTGKARPPFFGAPSLPTNWPVEWDRMIDKDSQDPVRFARRIDTHLALPLGELLNEGESLPDDPGGRIATLLKQLARRNLRRGYVLSLPTGQAVARLLDEPPLTAEELREGSSAEVVQALTDGGLLDRTPLWFYLLKEAEVRANGATLGVVGSRIVASTIIGQIRLDRTSYLNQTSWGPGDGVRLRDGRPIRSIADFLRFAGVLA
ncbi:heme peroxidase family protein [Pseudonocardia yuanmonensis]|uniref:Heme peroxidase family protein n=1 Tax=Pseudonocardia yuanmonensis TaxID=1095914 RepID=A0ABP8XGK8_9PSEU